MLQYVDTLTIMISKIFELKYTIIIKLINYTIIL